MVYKFTSDYLQRLTRICRVLKRSPRPLTLQDLMEKSDTNYNTLRHPLNALIEAGIVKSDKKIYSLTEEANKKSHPALYFMTPQACKFIFKNKASVSLFILQRAYVVASHWYPELFKDDLPKLKTYLRKKMKKTGNLIEFAQEISAKDLVCPTHDQGFSLSTPTQEEVSPP